MSRMVIESSVREAGTDPIFRVAGEAAQRTKELGTEAVINSTIGALMDDHGDLVAFKSVFDVLIMPGFRGFQNFWIRWWTPALSPTDQKAISAQWQHRAEPVLCATRCATTPSLATRF